MVNSLPLGWIGDLCTTPGFVHASDTWLHKFWELANTSLKHIPKELTSYMIVPVCMPGSSGSKALASPDFCQRSSTLSTAYMQALPPGSADLLSTLGCQCIAWQAADVACNMPANQEPITAALTAASSHMETPLGQLVSTSRLSNEQLKAFRHLVAHHVLPTEAQHSAAWLVLRQCVIFETANASMTALPPDCQYIILPNAAWERHLPQIQRLLPSVVVLYHTASDTQRKLLRFACWEPADLPTFLCDQLLPELTAHGISITYDLLLQMLEDLDQHPSQPLPQKLALVIDGRQMPVNRLVDSSSRVLKKLFTGQLTNVASLCRRTALLLLLLS